MIDHKHCYVCGKVIPPEKELCNRCSVQELISPEREPIKFYEPSVEVELGLVKN